MIRTFTKYPSYIHASFDFTSIEPSGAEYTVRDDFDTTVETFVDYDSASRWVATQQGKDPNILDEYRVVYVDESHYDKDIPVNEWIPAYSESDARIRFRQKNASPTIRILRCYLDNY